MGNVAHHLLHDLAHDIRSALAAKAGNTSSSASSMTVAVVRRLSEVVAESPAATEVVAEDPKICEKGGRGQVLPAIATEYLWEDKVRFCMYATGLVYCFLGVSIVADLFMGAIERITKKKKITKLAKSRLRTSVVWNQTVANLTLMALGSSAPEILLSLNDILKRGFHSGKLGAATIVGSAAFNLFVIIAVCINSVPSGEVRQIKELGVFIVTAFMSIFAYAWLLFIVQINTKNIVEVWEGVLTFVWFFVLIIVSYFADVRWLSWEGLREFRQFGWRIIVPEKDEDEDEYETDTCSIIMCRLFLACCGGCKFVVCWLPKKLWRSLRKLRYTNLDMGEDDVENTSGSATSPDEPDSPKRVFNQDAQLLDPTTRKPIDNEHGILTFTADAFDVQAGEDARDYTIPVYRMNGCVGRVSVKYRLESLTAMPDYDYAEVSGELNYRDGITVAEITITILEKPSMHVDDQFQIILEEATGGATLNPNRDGGEAENLLTVTIHNTYQGVHNRSSRFVTFFDRTFNIQELRLGTKIWKETISEAFYCKGSREEQDNATISDWIVHLIWFPWKTTFAILTPPPNYVGGWFCFVISLIHIGWITILVGDLAELFGCVAGIDDSITAITFVALGTSVPDLFASRTAAKQDEFADASIVNVTGSNSVNVFLGIGLPWMWAAIYWEVAGADQVWKEKYPDYLYLDGAFIVDSKGMAFSVTVFTLYAFFCLVLIQVRRYIYGGELGGTADVKAYSSFFLLCLWLLYIGLSCWQITTEENDALIQFIVLLCSIPLLAVFMAIFGFFLRVLKISKQYIGEEGFWGIFIATAVIGVRFLVYFGLQFQWT